jgi:hypothetical protein
MSQVPHGTKAGAKAQTADALMELDAMAVLEAFEEVKETASESETLLELCNFAGSELSPTRRNRSAFAETVEEEFDFGESKIHFASEANQEDAIERFARIAPLPATALGQRKQT